VTAVGDAADLRRTSVRLGLQAGLLLVGCLLVVGTVLFVVYERAAAEAANQLLRDATTNIDAAAEAPPGVRVVVVTGDGLRSVSPGMPRGLPDEQQIAATLGDGRTRQVDVVRGGNSYTVRTAKVSERVTQAVLDRREAQEERGRILTALLTAGLVGVLLAALVAAWLARRTVRPMADTIALQRRFVADASHELRAPLTLLSTRAQLLARRLRRDSHAATDVVADVDGVVADTNVLAEILEDLLTAADTRGNVVETLDVTVLVGEVVDASAAEADRSGVTLTARGGPEPALVDGSRASLRRALTALVDNAVSHAATNVGVAVHHGTGRVEIEVSDDGPGVAQDQAPRLFERFTSHRPETTPGDTRRHYGLGLALVAEVAAHHQGQVAVSSRPHGAAGAVFTLTLPAHRATRRARWRSPGRWRTSRRAQGETSA